MQKALFNFVHGGSMMMQWSVFTMHKVRIFLFKHIFLQTKKLWFDFCPSGLRQHAVYY